MGTNRDREITVFILALLGLKGVGARTVTDIIGRHHDSLESSPYLDAEYAEALNVGKVIKALQSSDLSWEELERDAFEILESADNMGVLVLNPLSPEYPQRLLRNDSYPPILYCLGDDAALNPEKSVAMVGTRNPTDFGARMGRRLAELLASDDYVIVSGLAQLPNVALLPVDAAVVLVLISVFLTFIAGLIPSRSASRKDPVEALRSE